MAQRAQNKASEFCLTEEEVRRLILAPTNFRDRVILKTLYFTGIRREELCNLDVEDVDLERKRIHIRNGKGGKSRIVPIPDTLVADLRALIGRRKSGPVFLSQRGDRLAPRSVNYVVAQAGRLAGIRNPNPKRKEINPHLLRHSFARHYLKRGGRMHKLSQILGHDSVAITHSIYGTASEEEVAEEYAQVMGNMDL